MGALTEYSEPERLSPNHDVAGFDCGVASLDDWLRRRARANEMSGASRTYVVAANAMVVGYYCVSAGGIAIVDAPARLRRNMPDPVPIIILGRLAIDSGHQRRGLGVALLQDAVLRTRQAAGIVGVAGLLVHAIDDEAKSFYAKYGFIESPGHPMTMTLSLKLSS